jgi:hypothetical protein
VKAAESGKKSGKKSAKKSGKKDGMSRSRWFGHQLLTVTALGALLAAAVFAVTPAGNWVLRSAPGGPHTIAVLSQYTCDLSSYGYTGPQVSIGATAILGPTATLETGFSPLFLASGPVSFATSAATLPASVAARLANLSRMTLQATIPVSGAPAATPVAKIWGTVPDALLPTGPLRQLQVVNAVDTTFFSRPGIAWLRAPAPSLLFTPYRNGSALPAISCAAVPGPVTSVQYTVQGPASSAPFYACRSTYRSTPYLSPLSMSIEASGTRRVGQALTVTLSSPSTGLADPAPGIATALAFTGKLPVTGAQAGAVALNETTPNADVPTFTVSGRLLLKKRGAVTISYPRKFVYTIYKQRYKKAIFTCTLTSRTDGLTVQVT